MSNRLGRSHLLSHLLLACGCILLLASAAMAARPFRAVELESTPEWNRLAVLWQAMMDHSSDVIYSPTRFQELVKEVDAIDVDLAALTKRGLLPRPIAIDLKRVFHARYEYLREHYYTSESQVTLPAMESAAITAHWVVELQLGALRRANAGPEPDRKLMARAQSAIACELSFLETYERFRAEVEKRRQALVEEQKSGKDVDFRPFETERTRRTLLLLDAYRAKRISISRPVKALMPYLASLTLKPASAMQTPANAPPGS